jgi:hypothetical protein
MIHPILFLGINTKEKKMTESLSPFPASNSDTLPKKGPARKRGGQHGNRNALKHGFYSHTFSREELKRLDDDVQGEFHDEEELLRILMGHVAVAVKKKVYSDLDNLVALRAVCLAMGRIESLHRTRKAIYDNQTTLDKVLEELNYLPVEED